MPSARAFHIYIMASRPWGTLYIGVTGDLFRRVFQHKQSLLEGFTKEHGVNNLVYYEDFATATAAIHREKRLKKWTRTWKVNLIRTHNPDWKDLAADWYPKAMTAAEIDAWLNQIAPEEIGSPGRVTRAPGDDGGGDCDTDGASGCDGIKGDDITR